MYIVVLWLINWPTIRRAAERRGMMRYCSVLVDSLTWPGMSLSFVNIHIVIWDFLLVAEKKCLYAPIVVLWCVLYVVGWWSGDSKIVGVGRSPAWPARPPGIKWYWLTINDIIFLSIPAKINFPDFNSIQIQRERLTDRQTDRFIDKQVCWGIYV